MVAGSLTPFSFDISGVTDLKIAFMSNYSGVAGIIISRNIYSEISPRKFVLTVKIGIRYINMVDRLTMRIMIKYCTIRIIILNNWRFAMSYISEWPFSCLT